MTNREHNSHRHSHLIIILLSVLVGAFVATMACRLPAQTGQTPAAAQTTMSDLDEVFVRVAERTLPAVVRIDVESSSAVGGEFDQQMEEFFRRLFPFRDLPDDDEEEEETPEPQRYRQQGMGSGWIYSEDGYIVTNAHVVEGATKITVELHDRDGDKTEYPATLVGLDPKTELAVIKVDAGRKLPTLALGDSDAAPIASWVMAVGAPFQLEQTVTVGVISAKSRFLPGTRDYIRLGDIIQTDAAINPGNSGGPLVNLRGEVIGINVAYRPGQFGGNAGIGFAIPASTAKTVIPDLIKHKKVARGWLGVEIDDLTAAQRKFFGAEQGGAWVGNITPGSPAAKSDLQVEDIIVAVGDKPVPDTWTLQKLIGSTAPGTTVTLTVIRNKQEKKIDVTLEQLPDKYAGLTPETEEPQVAENWPLGIRVADLNAETAQVLGLKRTQGVVIQHVDRNSPAAGKLIPGLVILKVNGHEVGSVEEYRAQMDKAKAEGADTVILHVEQETKEGVTVSLVDLNAEW